MTVYIVTGANSGLGLEATRQLAVLEGTSRVYLACRSEDKAHAAIKELRETTSRADVFKFLRFDAANKISALNAASAITEEHIDGLVLNAGGSGSDTEGKAQESGLTCIAEMNLLGHVVLVDALLASGKLGPGSRIVFAGSESARGVRSMAIPPPEWGDDVESFVGHLNGAAYQKYDSGKAYSYIKGIGALYFAALARRHPQMYVATVSPGASSTNLMQQQNAGPLKGLITKAMMPLGRMLGVVHGADVGAKRYVDAVTGTAGWTYPSGAFVACVKNASGPICNQIDVPHGAVFGDEAKQDLAWESVRRFM